MSLSSDFSIHKVNKKKKTKNQKKIARRDITDTSSSDSDMFQSNDNSKFKKSKLTKRRNNYSSSSSKDESHDIKNKRTTRNFPNKNRDLPKKLP